MRQILFRGKCFGNKEWIKDGEWVEGLPMYTANKSEKGKIDRILTLRDGYYSILLVCPETVCQYTGLTDKTGRKIFENDIIECKRNNQHFQSQIEWDSMCGGFMFQDTKEGSAVGLDALLSCGIYNDFKLIGNIFDNSELIGADKQG